MSFKQEEHKLLVIPGPVECSDEGECAPRAPDVRLTRPPAVLYANAHPSMSHVSPAFAPVFGYCLKALRKVVYTQTAQPFIIAGSGTLGW